MRYFEVESFPEEEQEEVVVVVVLVTLTQWERFIANFTMP